MTFQRDAGIQGRQFTEQCDLVLRRAGYQMAGRLILPDIGVEIDQVATSPGGSTIWFEYKGSVQGSRPGLMRTDTLKKAIANGALLAAIPARHPYVVLTSHLPQAGAAASMLRAALDLGIIAHAICVYDPTDSNRLRNL